MNAKDCRNDLESGLVYFTFTEVTDGSTREALGTLHPVYLANVKFSGKGVTYDRTRIVRYYDLMEGEFRSFYVDLVEEWSKL